MVGVWQRRKGSLGCGTGAKAKDSFTASKNGVVADLPSS